MEKATPTIVGCLFVGSGRATMKLHCIQYNVAVVVQQCNYIAALPLPTTMGGVAFFIFEVVYWRSTLPKKYYILQVVY
jgi:hypothetical protein